MEDIGERYHFAENLILFQESLVGKIHPDLLYSLNSYQEVGCCSVLFSVSRAHMHSDYQPSLGYINYFRIQSKTGKSLYAAYCTQPILMELVKLWAFVTCVEKRPLQTL